MIELGFHRRKLLISITAEPHPKEYQSLGSQLSLFYPRLLLVRNIPGWVPVDWEEDRWWCTNDWAEKLLFVENSNFSSLPVLIFAFLRAGPDRGRGETDSCVSPSSIMRHCQGTDCRVLDQARSEDTLNWLGSVPSPCSRSKNPSPTLIIYISIQQDEFWNPIKLTVKFLWKENWKIYCLLRFLYCQ